MSVCILHSASLTSSFSFLLLDSRFCGSFRSCSSRFAIQNMTCDDLLLVAGMLPRVFWLDYEIHTMLSQP
jgi:hypothetical protein